MRADTASAIHAQWIAAMEQRTASVAGEARRALEARLAMLRASSTAAPDETPASRPPSGLRELVAALAREGSPEHAAYPDVPALAHFRQLWSTLHADSQLRQSVAPSPTDAGPLNSTALANRAIGLMQELSPAYLRAFLAYVDDLAWLEQMGESGSSAGSAAARRKRARGKPQR